MREDDSFDICVLVDPNLQGLEIQVAGSPWRCGLILFKSRSFDERTTVLSFSNQSRSIAPPRGLEVAQTRDSIWL
ncbi:hypothetical protein EVAR_60101_1 [Eumeta japonica]|uniref:Uncharacterized protein n=1 Tax=Eumeta variegata TaxID=151549 RepID=A0A4C2A3S7_EUMVA|nr:hypothetical protein EVAR_60101_1 [Eumeta japonica]